MTLQEHTAVSSVRAGKPVIVTRTFSKLHGMAGLRVGYAIAPPELIAQLEKLRVTAMSYPGVMAATASLQDTKFAGYGVSGIQPRAHSRMPGADRRCSGGTRPALRAQSRQFHLLRYRRFTA